MLKFLNENKIAILVGVLVIAVISVIFVVSLNKPSRDEGVVLQDVKRVTGEIDIRNAFIKVAKTVGPAVVSISTERTQKLKASPFPFRNERSPFQDEFFQRFFKDFFKNAPEEYERKQAGLGSGVIIDKEGHILTNEHVVSGADKITVTLPDGRKSEGKVKGSDIKSDLAIIKIDADNLPVAVLGNSDLVQTGEWIVAIGNPFGYIVDSPKPTVTVGVVSALHRSLPSRKSGYLDLIQTDAAINPGNSGGPLCNLEGEVVGINVAIFSTTGGHQGIGFAIPANSAKAVIGDLKEGKKISYGWIGVIIQDVTEDIAKYFGLPDQKGVLIAQVVKGGPAYKAGLKEGDIIVEFDGERVSNTKDLVVHIARLTVGKKAKITVARNKVEIPVFVEIGQMPSEEELALMQGREIEPKEEVVVAKWRGLEASPITRDIAARLNIKDREGVIVIDVTQGSPAYHANLRRGDVIRRINTKKIGAIEDYKEAVKDLKGDALLYTDRGVTVVKEQRNDE